MQCCAVALPKEMAVRHPRMALLADELRVVQHARQHHSVVYVMGRTHARLGKDASLLQLPRRYLLEMPFKACPGLGSGVCGISTYMHGLLTPFFVVQPGMLIVALLTLRKLSCRTRSWS